MKRLCESCNKKRDEERFVGERGKTCDLCRRKKSRASARARHLEKTYEITSEEYDEIVEVQGGVCAICKGSRPYNLAVDHDHALAQQFHSIRASLRGALCKRCNKLLRDVHDDIPLLCAAIDYLLNPPAKKVLFP